MKVTLMGIGAGTETLTLQARRAIDEASLIIGAPRLIEALSGSCGRTEAAGGSTRKWIAETSSEAIVKRVQLQNHGRACVVLSGDSGFYSAARLLRPKLLDAGLEVTVLPGISSVSMLAARLGRTWQDWTLVSAHGVAADIMAAVMKGKPTFVLCDATTTPSAICSLLFEAGLGSVRVTVGERLGAADERIVENNAASLRFERFDVLSVVLIDEVVCTLRRASGWPDADFIRGSIPMTKRPVRAMALGMLEVGPYDVCWDVGAGTGSVSVEMASLCSRVYAVEMNPDAVGLIRANREKFHAWNLTVVEGRAPEALRALPRPDKVFIGGSRGALRPILEVAVSSKGALRICASAICLETLGEAVDSMRDLGLEYAVSQISASSSKAVGSSTMMIASNPVYLIEGVKR